MRNTSRILVLALSALCLLFPHVCSAQFTVELACPPSTNVLFPVGQTFDVATAAYRQWLCVDPFGNVTIQQGAATQPPLINTIPMYSGFRATANGLQVINYFGSGVNANIANQANTLNYPGETTLTGACATTFACQYMGNVAFQTPTVASLNTVVGNECCANANSGSYPILSWNKVTFRAAYGTPSTINGTRWWMGLSVFANASALGINGTATLATTAYAQDLPNKTTIGWRCNPATNLDWMAIELQANNAGVISTVLDSHVLCTDTAIHTWDMTLSPDSSTITWFIDGKQVAQAASIINISVANTNVLDVMSQLFYTGDNRNAAVQPGMVFFYAVMIERQ